MSEHLNTERISALLDAPWADKEGQAHLEACADCQVEYERLSRMRMALSALPDEEPPMGQWAAIETALEASDFAGRGETPFMRRIARRVLVPGPLQAAAGLVLFAGGVLAGLQLTSSADPGESSADLPLVVSAGEERAMLDGLNQMESLRSQLRQVGIGAPGPSGADGALLRPDPVRSAQLLVQLEGSIRALRERVNANPDDAVASAYLLELVEIRDQLTEDLGRESGTSTW